MIDQDPHLSAWLALSLLPGIGPATGRRLLTLFPKPEEVFLASTEELRQKSGLPQQAIEKILAGGARNEAAEQIDRCRKEGVVIIPLCSEDYPPLLAQIDNPPMQLFVKGDPSLLKTDCIAIVGARAATSYGIEMAGRFATDLGGRNYTVVSGMATGIDAAAHYGCLGVRGKTIAVLGCGVNRAYPSQNRKLYQCIADSGALVSEYPLDTEPDAFRFPARNRIISGLSLGVMVVEAAKRSGSLITAQLALEQNREVFAVPGRIDSFKSAGTHNMLQQGAKLVLRVEDIIEELPPRQTEDPGSMLRSLLSVVQTEGLDEESKIVFELLDVYPVDIETLIRQTGMAAQQVSEALLLLELGGLIESLPGKQYRRLSMS